MHGCLGYGVGRDGVFAQSCADVVCEYLGAYFKIAVGLGGGFFLAAFIGWGCGE